MNLTSSLINPDLILVDLSKNWGNTIIYVVAIALYTAIIWHFYRNLSNKTLFKLDIEKPTRFKFLHKMWEFILFIIRAAILFPLYSILWFSILSMFLLFLSKSQDVGQILLMSVTLISVARITAYFNEDLSKDVAKIIPFTLLGVFIVDPTYFSIEKTISKILLLPSYLPNILQYFLFIVVLEFLLRIIYRITTPSLE